MKSFLQCVPLSGIAGNRSPRNRLRLAPGALLSLALITACIFSSGCGATPAASYRLNMVEATKQRLTAEQERQVATVLLAMFGTTDEPVAMAWTGLDEAKLRLASGPVRSDIVGRFPFEYRSTRHG